MGYEACWRNGDLRVRAQDFQEAFRLLKQRDQNRQGPHDLGPFGGEAGVSFPDTLDRIDWHIDFEADGECRIRREGWSRWEEMEEIVWEAIAPVVVSGSYVEFQGEDGALWKWEFRDKKLRTFEGHIAWVADGEC